MSSCKRFSKIFALLKLCSKSFSAQTKFHSAEVLNLQWFRWFFCRFFQFGIMSQSAVSTKNVSFRDLTGYFFWLAMLYITKFVHIAEVFKNMLLIVCCFWISPPRPIAVEVLGLSSFLQSKKSNKSVIRKTIHFDDCHEFWKFRFENVLFNFGLE